MKPQVRIECVWQGGLPMVALDGHLSVYRPDCHTLAVLQLADSKGGITVEDVNQDLLGGMRRQIAQRMVDQAQRDRLLEEHEGRLILSEWGRASLKEDKKAWVEHSTGAWMFLLSEGLSPLVEGLPVVPIASVDEKSPSAAWAPMPTDASRRYPSLARLLAAIESGASFDAWFMDGREKMLICPTSRPPKTLVRSVSTRLHVEYTDVTGWRLELVEFSRMVSAEHKMASGLRGHKLEGKPPSYFSTYLNKAGFIQRSDGKYEMRDEAVGQDAVDFHELQFRHHLKIGSWELTFFGPLAAKDQDQALRWYVQHAVQFQGVPSIREILDQSLKYLQQAGVPVEGVDVERLKAAFSEVQPIGMNRAQLSRLMHAIYFETK